MAQFTLYFSPAGVYVCVSTICAWVHLHMCIRVYRTEDNLGCCSSGDDHLIIFFRQRLYLAQNLSSRLGWLPVIPKNLPISSLPTLGLQVCTTMLPFIIYCFFNMGFGNLFQVLVISMKALYWDISLALSSRVLDITSSKQWSPCVRRFIWVDIVT